LRNWTRPATLHVSRICLRILPIVIAVVLAFAVRAQTSNTLYGPSGVSPMAVRQGVLGSCYFHASVAAVAKASPSAIQNAISGDAQRGYRIHFVTGPEELVYPQDIEYARAHNYDRSEGQWVTVLMRGYAQRELRQGMVDAIQRSTVIPIFVKPIALSALRQSGPLLLAYDRAVRSVVNQDGQMDKANFQAQLTKELSSLGIPAAQSQVLVGLLAQSGFYDAISSTVRKNGEVFGAYRSFGQGGIPGSVIRAFLGTAESASISSGTLREQLRSLHAGGTAIIAGTNASAFNASFGGQSPDWYVPTHAYTLLDYDESSRTILLRNPWGARPGPDGVFKLPLNVFLQAYETYSYHDGASQ
jgi:hypothetical protein